jgi:hypothetical protein
MWAGAGVGIGNQPSSRNSDNTSRRRCSRRARNQGHHKALELDDAVVHRSRLGRGWIRGVEARQATRRAARTWLLAVATQPEIQ